MKVWNYEINHWRHFHRILFDPPILRYPFGWGVHHVRTRVHTVQKTDDRLHSICVWVGGGVIAELKVPPFTRRIGCEICPLVPKYCTYPGTGTGGTYPRTVSIMRWDERELSSNENNSLNRVLSEYHLCGFRVGSCYVNSSQRIQASYHKQVPSTLIDFNLYLFKIIPPGPYVYSIPEHKRVVNSIIFWVVAIRSLRRHD